MSQALERIRQVLRAKLAEFAAQGKFEETVVSLAVIGKLAVSVVDALMTNKDDGGILLLCKGIGLDWSTTCRFVALLEQNSGRYHE